MVFLGVRQKGSLEFWDIFFEITELYVSIPGVFVGAIPIECVVYVYTAMVVDEFI